MRPTIPVFLSLVVAFAVPAFAQPHLTADERGASPADERGVTLDVVGYDLVGVPAGGAFVDDLQRTFILTQFVKEAPSYGPKAMLPFVDDQCPDGWEQRTDDDGELLFYAFGLLVTADDTPRSSYVRMPACVKQ